MEGQRYCSPETGRWLSRDPIGESEGANLFAFVLNAPHTYVDIDGRRLFPDIPGDRWPPVDYYPGVPKDWLHPATPRPAPPDPPPCCRFNLGECAGCYALCYATGMLSCTAPCYNLSPTGTALCLLILGQSCSWTVGTTCANFCGDVAMECD